mgnify:CR=1 FL=1
MSESTGDLSDTNADIRYSIAYRPLNSKWIWLNRLDLIYEDEQGLKSLTSMRIVNQSDLNYLPNERTQIAFQYGFKYVIDDIDGDSFQGATDFFGIESRFDLTTRIDLGLRASVRHSWNSHIFDYSVGPSIGFNPAKNVWVSLGYNFTGYSDTDFSESNYTAQGIYVQFRLKIDQDTLKDLGSLIKFER